MNIRQIGAWLIYGGTFSLREYEIRCLQEWQARLDQQGARLLDAQLAWLDRYKRLSRGKVVMFFSTRVANGEQLPESMLFPCRDEEARVARISLTLKTEHSPTTLVGTIVLFRGELMSLEFSKEPPFRKLGNIDVTKVEVIQDPMRMAPALAAASLDPEALSGWLRRRAKALRDVRRPLPAEKRAALLRGIASAFPDDYMHWMGTTNGFRAGDVRVLGLDEVWSAPRPDGVFMIFAQIEHTGDLAVRSDESTGQTYWLGYEDTRALAVKSSLADVIDKRIDGAA